MTAQVIPLRVECYAGHRGEQTPRVIALGERRIEVAEVLDQWLAPDHRYFKVKDAAGDVYIVRHDVASGEWELTMFSAGSHSSSA
jgi:hypothetical protein